MDYQIGIYKCAYLDFDGLWINYYGKIGGY